MEYLNLKEFAELIGMKYPTFYAKLNRYKYHYFGVKQCDKIIGGLEKVIEVLNKEINNFQNLKNNGREKK